MSGEIKILEFAEGTTTTAPQQLATYALMNIYSTATSYTITDTDNYNLIIASGAGTNITLPLPANNDKRDITVKRNDPTNAITVTAHSGANIDGDASITLDMDEMARAFAINSTTSTYVIH